MMFTLCSVYVPSTCTVKFNAILKRFTNKCSYMERKKTPTGPVPYVIYRKIHCSVADQGSVNISRTLLKIILFQVPSRL